MSEAKGKLDRARGYPYAIPEESYVWRGGETTAFDPGMRKDRTPVLAIGSNQSPQQLTRKFGTEGEIPVQRARLRDFDIYYSAHITGYGSVPAMLQRAPGTDVTLSVNWLDERQLDIMHGTELYAAKYRYEVIEGINLALDCGTEMDFARLYVGVNGHLMHEGEAVALAAIHADARRPSALTTAEVLEVVRERFAPEYDSDAFVLKLVEDIDFRADCTRAISSDSVPFGHPSRPAGT
jgi:hypothetical protein